MNWAGKKIVPHQLNNSVTGKSRELIFVVLGKNHKIFFPRNFFPEGDAPTPVSNFFFIFNFFSYFHGINRCSTTQIWISFRKFKISIFNGELEPKRVKNTSTFNLIFSSALVKSVRFFKNLLEIDRSTI